jgi:hypothetical protein
MDKEYYVLERPARDEVSLLSATRNTASDNFRKYGQYLSKPLYFTNDWRDENVKAGILEEQSHILFNGNDILISKEVVDVLRLLDIQNVDFTSAIYIDDKDQYREDYYFVRFKEKVDCWSRLDSDYNKKPRASSGLHYVYSYSLDDEVLKRMNLKSRFIFRMGGTSLSLCFVHEALAEELLKLGIPSDYLTPVLSYEG